MFRRFPSYTVMVNYMDRTRCRPLDEPERTLPRWNYTVCKACPLRISARTVSDNVIPHQKSTDEVFGKPKPKSAEHSTQSIFGVGDTVGSCQCDQAGLCDKQADLANVSGRSR